MTKEEVLEFLKSEDGTGLVNEMGFVTREELERQTTGLKSKNSELLEKIVKNKEKRQLADAVKNDLDKYNIKDYTELSDLLDKLNNPDIPDDVRKLKNDLIKANAELEKYKNDYQVKEEEFSNVNSELKSLMVNTKIKQSLLAEGCTEVQADAISKYVLSMTSFDVVSDDNGRKAAITTTGLNPSEFMAQWMKTPEAKDLLPVKPSVGGGGVGSSSHQQGVNVNSIISNAVKQGDTLSAMRVIDSIHKQQ